MIAPAQTSDQEEPSDSSSWNTRPLSRAAVVPPEGASLAGTETVLLVDGTPMMRGVMARLLRQLGYRVVEASGAHEAQRLAASRGEFRLLLLNHSAPERTDLELALWFRAMYPEMKILVACVSLWDLNYHIGEERQINFLAKPFTARELARMVRRVLEN
jgi:two-component system cell cycle sensor histidine kinase/response regulator CckA